MDSNDVSNITLWKMSIYTNDNLRAHFNISKRWIYNYSACMDIFTIENLVCTNFFDYLSICSTFPLWFMCVWHGRCTVAATQSDNTHLKHMLEVQHRVL